MGNHCILLEIGLKHRENANWQSVKPKIIGEILILMAPPVDVTVCLNVASALTYVRLVLFF